MYHRIHFYLVSFAIVSFACFDFMHYRYDSVYFIIYIAKIFTSILHIFYFNLFLCIQYIYEIVMLIVFFCINSPVVLMNCLTILIQVENFQDHLMMVIHKLQIFTLEISHPRFGSQVNE